MARTVSVDGSSVRPSNNWAPPGCLNCGPVELQPVFDGEITNFYCDLCGACWHFELGFAIPIHPETCPGCALELQCRERYESA
ncbi:MAG TPA: hypothetical protein VFK43_20440 [Acidimicrobiales bacterium]|nr:hypothetical protein [Acidimicrobiales bacterium]